MAEKNVSSWRTIFPFRKIPKKYSHELPMEHVGLVSFLTYTWLDRFMWKTFRSGIDSNNIWQCPAVDECHLNADKLEGTWNEEVSKHGMSNASLARVIRRLVGCRFLVSGLSLFISLVLLLVSVAYIMMTILRLTVDDHEPIWRGLILVAALFIVNTLSAILFMGSISISQIAGGRLRAGLLCLLYRKLMTVTSLPDKTVGKVINLFISDGLRIYDGVGMAPMLLAGPLLAAGSTVYAIILLGPWALIGFAILLLLLPAQMTAGKLFMTFRSRAIGITDKRVRMMTEYLANARFIKMYCWEKALEQHISAVRSDEQSVLEKANLSMSFAFLTSGVIVAIATISTLIAYTSSGNHLDSVQAFLYLLVYTCIQDKLELCMLSVKLVSESFVAAGRFQEIFLLNEVNVGKKDADERYLRNYLGTNAVEMECLSYDWPASSNISSCNSDANQGKDQLESGPPKKQKRNDNAGKKTEEANGVELKTLMSNGVDDGNKIVWKLDIKVQKGSVVGLMGPVSSGKTALLKAMLGQMNVIDGRVLVDGSMAYVPQQAWVFNASIRDNVVFGKDFNDSRYKSVIESCCLVDDISMIGGDLTEIGERGVTLSGGQKQRISLARALYSDRDIYLLDDPLASVDPDVAESLFNRVILNDLVGKTVILVTHQVKFLRHCDRIIHLSEGRVIEDGSPDQLMDADGSYAKLIRTLDAERKDREPIQLIESQKQGATAVDIARPQSDSNGRMGGHARLSKVDNDTVYDSTSFENAALNPKESSDTNKALMTEEEKIEGAVSFDTYSSYIKAGGGAPAILMVVFVSILAELSRAFSYWWLAHWIEEGSGNTTILVNNETVLSDNITDNPKLWMYDLVYGMSLVAVIFFFVLRSLALIKALMRASSRLHDRLFAKIMNTTILFFDTTPLGRIVNRFSRDMDEMDSKLPMLIDITLRSLLNILIYLALIAAIIPWFLIAIPVSAVVFLPLYFVFRAGVREIQRLQLMSTSPLLSHVDASLRGVASIKAYGRIPDFETRFETFLNRNTVALFLSHFSARWVGVRLCLVTNALVSVTALILLLLRSDIPTSYAGAAMVYAFQLLTLFQLFVRFAVDAGATFTSTERIRSYSKNLKPEESHAKKTFALANNWAEQGEISFTDFKLRYRDNLPLALNGVDFQIHSREKVGIVGRTGSGKSSLVAALFRLVEGAGGQIDIDGVDISLISLQDLRTKLSIIPQDPVLFSGSIRHNLDPFNQHIDMELWNALERCHLKETVLLLEGQLLSQVHQNGENFSQGERQLLCMARVLLRHTRIMILDEATASLDHETEDHIQKTLNETFADCTVLIIAHRLKTVLQCDRVLVMEEGKVLEFDEPSVLLADSNSRFCRLVATASGDIIDDALAPDGAQPAAWV